MRLLINKKPHSTFSNKMTKVVSFPSKGFGFLDIDAIFLGFGSWFGHHDVLFFVSFKKGSRGWWCGCQKENIFREWLKNGFWDYRSFEGGGD